MNGDENSYFINKKQPLYESLKDPTRLRKSSSGIRDDFEGLSWEDIQFDVPIKKRSFLKTVIQQKVILRAVSGSARKGRFLAIMGASGAGKSTLLNIIAHRLMPTDGIVYYNGVPINEVQGMNQRMAYVMQEDILMKTLTAREALTFSAMLRLRDMNFEQKQQRIAEVLAELGLTNCADTRIGSAESGGLSGGERKRLAIAIELIHDPPVIMLDEPTSGLDSYTAESVVTILSKLAANGRTVIATIHQPSSEIFAMFDELIVMAMGSIVFSGPAPSAVDYFAQLGYKIPELTNPSDFFMRLLRIEDTESDATLVGDSNQIGQKFVDAWISNSKGPLAQRNISGINVEVPIGYAAGFFAQLFILGRRNALNILREPMLSTIRLVQGLIIGGFCGLVYLQLDHSQAGVMSRMSALYFVMINQSMGPLFGVLNAFPAERTILLREKENGMYYLSSYYISKIVTELPLQAFFPVVMIAVLYFLIGFNNTFLSFWVYCLIVILVSLIAQGLGLFISACTNSMNSALAIGPMILLPFMLFGGFLTQTDSIPIYFKWLNTISFFRLGFHAAAVNEFKDNAPYCTIPCFPYPDGAAVLKFYSVDPDCLWMNILYMSFYAIGMRMLAFFVLWFRTRPKLSA